MKATEKLVAFFLEADKSPYKQHLTRYPQYTVLCSYRGYKRHFNFLILSFYETKNFKLNL